MTLRYRFAMHMRHQNGATYGHEIFDDELNMVVGYRSSFTPRGRYSVKHPATQVFTLKDDKREFSTAKDFLAAYDEKRKTP